MDPLTALLLFVGIPVGFGIVVYVLVSASSWTRSGRASADYDDGPFMVASEAAMPDPSRLPREIASGPTSLAGGGVGGKW
ncbi:MAG: hypothetical protein IPO93_12635 [Actinobacteria bacterium]|nr:hypothetical protein [Actinomycetota bacterium]